ncbi:MAG: N-acyl homoserine lactonase family protein [Planctomycetes bacterium]|nr:N-acyl homoserine lactonase family protein [Planctomycetota bacterium]
MKVRGLSFSVFTIGHIHNDKSWNVALSQFATKSNPNPANIFWRVPIVCALVKHPEAGNFLFDTGYNLWDWESRTDYQKETFPIEIEREEFIDRQLGKVGLGVQDIDGIFLSHLHWDHANGLAFFEGQKAIKNVYVRTQEAWDALLNTHGGPDYVEVDPLYSKAVLDIPGMKYKLIDQDTEVFPGIHLFTLEGHTRGCLGMLLECECGATIFTGDAIYSEENYGPPVKVPGIVKDTVAYFRCVEKVRKLQEQYSAKLIFPHDVTLEEKWKLAPHFYR